MTKAAQPPEPINERLALSLLALVQFTHVMDFMIMMPLGSHLMRVFSISPEQFSHLVAAYGLSAGVFGFAGGFVLDRFERKHALLSLYAGFCLATLTCALAPNPTVLLLARVFAGACGGVASSVVSAMVSDMVPPQRRGRAMGHVMAAFPLASVAGVPCGLWLAAKYEWHAPFFMLSAMSAVILMIALKALPHVQSHLTTANPFDQMKAILSHRVHLRGFLLSAVLVFAGACLVPFMAPSMVSNVGLPENKLFEIYLFGGLATFGSTFLIGRLSDRFDKLHVLSGVSALAVITVYFVTRLEPGPVVFTLLVTTVFFVGMSGRFAPAMGMISIAVDPRYRGGFMSVNSAIQQLASGFANIVAGWMITKDTAGRLVGFPSVGYLSTGAFVGTVLLAWWLRSAVPHAAKPHRHTAIAEEAIAPMPD
jgi:predicted MFS family arabinose efflux permease